MMKRIRFGVLYALAMIGLVVAVDYALYWRYVATLAERQKPAADFPAVPNVSEATLRRLGSVSLGKLTSFTQFAPAKPAGTIRIGAFGDSYTNGNEVDESSDFPRQLAVLLDGEGLDGVEVINFGSSWHGFAQAFIMWNEVGRGYDLDAILLGPGTFFPSRDTRFNHADGVSPYYLHSRFVVEDGALRLIDVIGDTRAQRFRRYFGFLTPWQYLRYDRNEPAFLAAALPEGKTLGNPFYYDRRSEQDEAGDIYRGLMQRMLQSGTPIVLGVYPQFDHARQAVAQLAGEGFCPAAFERRVEFPYLAPEAHNGPTGNVLLAHQFLSLLVGRPVVAPIVRTAPLDRVAAPMRAPSANLADYEDVRIVVNGIEAGRFATRAGGEAASFLHDRGIRAMLALADASVLDGVFLAFHDAVDVSAPARLVLRSSQGPASVPLTRLPETREEVGFAALELPGLEAPRQASISVSTAALAHLFGDRELTGTVQLVLGDIVVLEGSIDADAERVMLDPEQADLYLLRASSTGDAAADRGSAAGLAEMVLSHGDATIAIPLARWWIEQHAMDPAASCPPGWRPLLPSAGLSNDLRQSAP